MKNIILIAVLLLGLGAGIGTYVWATRSTPPTAAPLIVEMQVVNDSAGVVTFLHHPSPAVLLGEADPIGPLGGLPAGFTRLSPGESTVSTHTETGVVSSGDYRSLITGWTAGSGGIESAHAEAPQGSWTVRFHEDAETARFTASVTEGMASP